MSGPSQIYSNDASAHRKHGILTPTSESTINVGEQWEGSSRKRKRGQGIHEDRLQDPFVIRPHPSSVIDTPRTLTPVLILPRSGLPLSFITTTTKSPIPSFAQLFFASIRTLDVLNYWEVGKDESKVLIAECEIERNFHAVEKVEAGIFAVCKLGSWVRIEDLRAAAATAEESVLPVRRKESFTNDVVWWTGATVPIETEHCRRIRSWTSARQIDNVRISMKWPQNAVMHPAESCHELSEKVPQNHQVTFVEAAVVIKAPVGPIPPATPDNGPTAQDIFDMIRTQYLETLHISKTSLAYFAKGPLSRARSAFSIDSDPSKVPSALVRFLRGSILTLKLMDKKYRDTVPELVDSFPVQTNSDNEVDGTSLQPARKRMTKKVKPGKDGLYSLEGTYVRRWWRAGDPDSHDASPGETRDEERKRRIAFLRARETKLQIMLILEIIALEASLLPDFQAKDLATADASQSKKIQRSNKKPQDLGLLLELLIDRLCIWQSVVTEDCESGFSKRMISKSIQHSTPSRRIGSNTLRDFCIEVIVPFYAMRLRKECAMINQKLGGSSGQSSLQNPPRKPANTVTKDARPGEVIDKTSASKFRRRLERVVTDTKLNQATHPPPPSLTRSATAPEILDFKREQSEVRLSTIPTSQPMVKRNKSTRALTSNRFSQREIDLNAVSSANEAKLRRKAALNDELQDAITALKKPNRGIAVREYVDLADIRNRTSKGTLRIQNIVASTGLQDVEVPVTGKRNRKKNMTPSLSRKDVDFSTVQEQPHPDYPFGVPYIPQSMTRPVTMPLMSTKHDLPGHSMVSSTYQNRGHSIQETPSRRSSNLMTYVPGTLTRPIGREGFPKHFPLVDVPYLQGSQTPSRTEKYTEGSGARESSVQETPSKQSRPAVAQDVLQMRLVKPSEAPISKNAYASISSCTSPSAVRADMDKSFYKSLGWDEDDADDLS